MTPPRRRSARWAIVVGGALAVGLVTVARPAAADPPAPEISNEIAVGVQLEALASVHLARAELAKGSRVRVIKLVHRRGSLAGLDVELADGQVARVAMTTVRELFRVIGD